MSAFPWYVRLWAMMIGLLYRTLVRRHLNSLPEPKSIEDRQARINAIAGFVATFLDRTVPAPYLWGIIVTDKHCHCRAVNVEDDQHDLFWQSMLREIDYQAQGEGKKVDEPEA